MEDFNEKHVLAIRFASDPDFWQRIMWNMRRASELLEIVNRGIESGEEEAAVTSALACKSLAERMAAELQGVLEAVTWSLPRLPRSIANDARHLLAQGQKFLPQEAAAICERIYNALIEVDDQAKANGDSLRRLFDFVAGEGGEAGQAILDSPIPADQKLIALDDLSPALSRRLREATLRELAELLGTSHEAIRKTTWWRDTHR